MKALAILTLLFLFGCGSSTVTATYHEVSNETLQAKSSDHIGGFAEWNNFDGTCDIYMMAKEEYRHIEEYHRVLGHEMRHCLEGEFH